MEQKLVSYKVAKALKEAGYTQGKENTAYYNEEGMLVKPCVFCGGKEIADAPTYLDAWLWLWNTKNIQIEVADKSYFAKAKVMGKFFVETNPEEAIAKAIDYLVEGNLIK